MFCSLSVRAQVGSEVARRAKGLGCNVIAYDPYASKELAAALGVTLMSLDETLAVRAGGGGRVRVRTRARVPLDERRRCVRAAGRACTCV